MVKSYDEYVLTNAKERNFLHPDTFKIPSDECINKLSEGHTVKLGFEFDRPGKCSGERMWVKIEKREGNNFTGFLNDTPYFLRIDYDKPIEFTSENIIEIY